MSEKKERYQASEEPETETYHLTESMALEVYGDEWCVGRSYVDSGGSPRVSERRGWYFRLTEADVAALAGIYQARKERED